MYRGQQIEQAIREGVEIKPPANGREAPCVNCSTCGKSCVVAMRLAYLEWRARMLAGPAEAVLFRNQFRTWGHHGNLVWRHRATGMHLWNPTLGEVFNFVELIEEVEERLPVAALDELPQVCD